MAQLSTGRDIVTSAKIRAEAEAEHKFSVKKIGVPALACLLVFICGITVSAAANLDWLKEILGSDVSLIEKNIDDYKVEIGNVKIENGEVINTKFSIGDVISDGSTILINILVEDERWELQWNRRRAQPGGVTLTEESSHYSSWNLLEWQEIDRTDNTVSTAVIMRFDDNIKKGDVFEFKLTNGSMKHDFLTPEEAKKWKSNLATVSFEIQNDINYMKKTIEVNKTATFRNRPFPIYEELTAVYAEEKNTPLKVNIDTISLSPLSIEIRGTIPPKQYGTGLTGYGNIWLVYKNGDRICIVPNGSTRNTKNGEFSIIGDFSLQSLGVNTGVIDWDEIEAIEFDGFTVPLNSDPVSETEE